MTHSPHCPTMSPCPFRPMTVTSDKIENGRGLPQAPLNIKCDRTGPGSPTACGPLALVRMKQGGRLKQTQDLAFSPSPAQPLASIEHRLSPWRPTDALTTLSFSAVWALFQRRWLSSGNVTITMPMDLRKYCAHQPSEP